jgi:hypothetical protein
MLESRILCEVPRRSQNSALSIDVGQAKIQIKNSIDSIVRSIARSCYASDYFSNAAARGNLGVAGEIELAEMAALPPFAQVIADMDGHGSVGSISG